MPSIAEKAYVKKHTRTKQNNTCMLILLKCTQRLGHFVFLARIPGSITKYIGKCTGTVVSIDMLKRYDRSRVRNNHMKAIRSLLGIKATGEEARVAAHVAMAAAARTKEDIVDILNVGIEELVRLRYELPAFEHFLRLARHARAETNADIYKSVHSSIPAELQEQLLKILETNPQTKKTPWNQLRQDPGKVTIKEIKNVVHRLAWIRSLDLPCDPFKSVPYVKIRHMASEARSFDANRVGSITNIPKKIALIAALIKTARARTIDDLCQMMVKKMGKIHYKGKKKLEEYLEENRDKTDRIVSSFKNIHDFVCDDDESDPLKRLNNIRMIFVSQPELIEFTDQHVIYGSKNYFRFLWPLFRNTRAAFFKILNELQLVSTSSDHALIQSVGFARAHQKRRALWVSIASDCPESEPTYLDLSWIPDRWWFLVTGEKRRRKVPEKVNRRQFEICLFSEIVRELRSADLCVKDSDAFNDFREQFVSTEELVEKLPRYTEITGLPIDGPGLVEHLKDYLGDEADQLDTSYPVNQEFRIDSKGGIWVKQLKAKPAIPGLKELRELIRSRMPQRDILDVVVDTQKILNWCRVFGPISGFESKLNNPELAYIVATFCYGCNLGPMQTSQCLPVLSRKQIAWINQRHITEEKIQKAIEILINAYNKFSLPQHWGSGDSASADGTRWDVNENNLLSEFHVRYGSYGGIGYYHVSDKYIALFSRFIPCGVYEAVYILDPFFPNKSDIKPHIIHGDTHGQSLAVFGLAYLLGIELMPRIAHWRDLKIYKPGQETYRHIDKLFTTEEINWGLIQRHYNDMLRVVVSIHEGRLAPSVILRRLTTGTRKNKLFYAFQELGKVVRSAYLLKYIREPKLRRVVNHATTVSESFNDFIQFVSFGNQGVIAENSRDEQRKIIKYGHLVANILIFMNVYDQSRVMNQLIKEGHVIGSKQAEGLSPYRKRNLNRFGTYHLDEYREAFKIDFGMEVVSFEPS